MAKAYVSWPDVIKGIQEAANRYAVCQDCRKQPVKAPGVEVFSNFIALCPCRLLRNKLRTHLWYWQSLPVILSKTEGIIYNHGISDKLKSFSVRIFQKIMGQRIFNFVQFIKSNRITNHFTLFTTQYQIGKIRLHDK